MYDVRKAISIVLHDIDVLCWFKWSYHPLKIRCSIGIYRRYIHHRNDGIHSISKSLMISLLLKHTFKYNPRNENESKNLRLWWVCAYSQKQLETNIVRAPYLSTSHHMCVLCSRCYMYVSYEYVWQSVCSEMTTSRCASTIQRTESLPISSDTNQFGCLLCHKIWDGFEFNTMYSIHTVCVLCWNSIACTQFRTFCFNHSLFCCWFDVVHTCTVLNIWSGEAAQNNHTTPPLPLPPPSPYMMTYT